MSKFDEFNLDIKGEGNSSNGNPRAITVDPWICTTAAVTMVCNGAVGVEYQGTLHGCSGDTISACRSYCGSSC